MYTIERRALNGFEWEVVFDEMPSHSVDEVCASLNTLTGREHRVILSPVTLVTQAQLEMAQVLLYNCKGYTPLTLEPI